MAEVTEERRPASGRDGAPEEAGRGDQERGKEGQGRQEGERRRDEQASTFGAVARDMAVGALVGAVVGAAWRVARTVQPEGAETLKTNVAGAAREMGAAAGTAVRDVVASKPVNELLSARSGDGRRAELMKSTLKEAVAAAGDAAKGVLESKGARGGSSRDE